ncbi:hypothetical protein CPB84DRAFT_1745087 [Gymnopilus junonius]|uniref:Uncharacterized protein n=1 Tax=Gymnopilus junonius TaxID=109634 RepID=A0A9P5NTL0_GYMJU|nr:hypothetical protein CPB84DRAFT_1745087 [Gymnopilus junonius]
MERPFLPKGVAYAQIPTSSSIPSLDIRILADASLQPSLLSESISICSLSSLESKSPTPFPSVKILPFRFIELGDQLKMFSVSEMSRHNASTSLVSSPTSPRLKLMLKECLSIPKWIEMCAALQAPGHIPWESLQETPSKDWRPEGSIFSPECFSRTLSQFRAPLSKTSPNSNPLTKPSTIRSFGLADTDLLDELQGSKSLLEVNTRVRADKPPARLAEPRKLSLPSLVVSNSQFTFPLPLEPSHSVSSSLASQRGKRAPPSLHLKKTKDLSYPDIPTAFLGSPSQHLPQFEYANRDNDPAPPFEEMITNLRLQCLTMSLQTPQDASFNSRSCLGSESASNIDSIDDKATTLDSDECNFATSSYPDYEFLPASRAYEVNRPRRPIPRKKKSEPDLFPSNAERYKMLPNIEPKINFHPVIPLAVKSSEAGLVRDTTSSLRSAMTKGRGPHCRAPLKNVRFVLTHDEVMQDAESSAALQEDKMVLQDRLNSEHSMTPPQLTRKGSSLRSTWRKARSVAISFPSRNSVTTDSVDPTVFRPLHNRWEDIL